jgi:hypothetical protein
MRMNAPIPHCVGSMTRVRARLKEECGISEARIGQ